MPYVCGRCDFFDVEGARGSACPSCGGDMRFTMLDPRATATATLDEPTQPAWQDAFAYGYEEIEAPWSFRYAQIGVGISTYSFVWCWGRRIVTLFIGAPLSGSRPEKTQFALGVGILVMNCLAALAGGAAAGFWARNWIPQGLGVAAGAIGIPLVFALIFPPGSWPLFSITLAATSALAAAGAFLGHLLVKPTRIAKS
ncbi:MAG: hypothetical protein HY288_19815 [Planctomycetia bacterium]|nr:hypothetical protein [Planctomycetia bacterium]